MAERERFHAEYMDDYDGESFVIFDKEGYVHATIYCNCFSKELTKVHVDDLVKAMNWSYYAIEFNRELRN